MSFRFKAMEGFQRCGDVVFDILITSKGASALGSFRNFYRSLNKTDVPCTNSREFKKLRRRGDAEENVEENDVIFNLRIFAIL